MAPTPPVKTRSGRVSKKTKKWEEQLVTKAPTKAAKAPTKAAKGAKGNSKVLKPAAKKNASKTSKKRTPDPMSEFQSNLYKEIDEAAQREGSQSTLDDIQDILCRARLSFFYHRLPVSKQEPVRKALERSPAVGGGSRTLARHERFRGVLEKAKDTIWADAKINHSRFLPFEGAFLILSICAHSKSFRDAIRRSDSDSQKDGLPKWAPVMAFIKSRFHSLELFARLRATIWEEPLKEHDRDFQRLIDTVLKGSVKSEDLNGRYLGMRDSDLQKCHPNLPKPVHTKNKHWYLAADEFSALKCELTYTVTRDLKRFGDKRKILNKSETVAQVKIEDSIFLSEYPWPNKHQWPEPDPRYTGFDEVKPCFHCDTSQTPIAKNTDKTLAQTIRGCTCDFAAVREENDYPQALLYELFETQHTGLVYEHCSGYPKNHYLKSITAKCTRTRQGLAGLHLLVMVANGAKHTVWRLKCQNAMKMRMAA